MTLAGRISRGGEIVTKITIEHENRRVAFVLHGVVTLELLIDRVTRAYNALIAMPGAHDA
jgi:hypothetical protein